jgi:hypothetical protein
MESALLSVRPLAEPFANCERFSARRQGLLVGEFEGLAGCGKTPLRVRNRHFGRTEAKSRDPEVFETSGFPLS